MHDSTQAVQSRVATLRFEQGRLALIDQRLLPQAFEYRYCDSAQSVAEAIRNMVVRGAPAIGCAAAYGVALEAQRQSGQPREAFQRALGVGFELLAASRPTAVNLAWALQRMRQKLAALSELPPRSTMASVAKKSPTMRWRILNDTCSPSTSAPRSK